MTDQINIGVLAIQGDFAAHIKALKRQGVTATEVRTAEQLAEVDGLILPGGETTTLIKLLKVFDLWEPLRQLGASGLPIYGTCAGLLLLAREVSNPVQPSLDLLPIAVERNAYGRQVDSFVAAGKVLIPRDLSEWYRGASDAADETTTDGQRLVDTEFVFIRAPKITNQFSDLEVLARHDGTAVLVRSGNILGGSFHPEMIDDGVVPGLFAAMVELARRKRRDTISAN
jgi:pyridoxal 5'-phosphate synthase pdxT subunit